MMCSAGRFLHQLGIFSSVFQTYVQDLPCTNSPSEKVRTYASFAQMREEIWWACSYLLALNLKLDIYYHLSKTIRS